ncbi:MAG TPA: DUF6351 family protein [Actinomycetota bacterium]|nr:DUF6351 family protein [Actinomycetota bacterium]
MANNARNRFALLGLLLGLLATTIPSLPSASAAGRAVKIRTLSNRADLISGGDALIQVSVPAGASTSDIRLSLNGKDVTGAFQEGSNGNGQGLIEGLKLGRNKVVASLPDGRAASLTITNHPLGGPVFGGPQIKPWTCQEEALDKKCNQEPTISYYYKPAGGGSLQPYDRDNPPPPESIAETTTTEEVTVPFIVREEIGYMARDQYAIATLWQPDKKWSPSEPQRQFNRRLVITHGASCDTSYEVGEAPAVLDEAILGAGFIVMSHALDNAGHACNLLMQAEALVMTKEYVIDHFGTVRWTIGMGCSGGSLVQQQVANAYPGLYQGITPQCSFTDAWSSAMQYVDYYMLLAYFNDPSRWDPGTSWSPDKMAAVLDHPNIGNPVSFTSVIPNSGNPSRSCPGVTADKVYNAETNPEGVRCTLQDYTVNAFGRRKKDGFANRPFDNVGIQYGLKGLRQGVLTPAEFVDLNTHLGGLDIDGNFQAKRSKADLIGLKRVYRTGLVDSANNLDKVAIIDLRGPDPGAFHDVYRTYAMRARLLRNFGTAANQVLWRGQVALVGDPSFAVDAVFAVDRWLARVDADDRDVPLAQKIIEDKPSDIADRCTDGSGREQVSWVCDQTVASYGTPRFAADAPYTDDVLKCRLQPLRKDDYSVEFTDEQWKRLQKAFPAGVCNYGKPGVHQMGATSWLTYQDARGRVIYGGRPLGPPPRSRPLKG